MTSDFAVIRPAPDQTMLETTRIVAIEMMVNFLVGAAARYHPGLTATEKAMALRAAADRMTGIPYHIA